MRSETLILGGGVSGLAAGMASGYPVLEAQAEPGGICSSYYFSRENRRVLAEEEAYRFEIGGGHWIFGGDPEILQALNALEPMETYARRASVYFQEVPLHVPYPLQNHVAEIPEELRQRAEREAKQQLRVATSNVKTLSDWLLTSFGPTLCSLFFDPFHELYTANLYGAISPQDAYKSPTSKPKAQSQVGYNVSFQYPRGGLDRLTLAMAKHCDVRYGKEIVRIDLETRRAYFRTGDYLEYESLLSTLPLNHMLRLTGLTVEEKEDPYTSVLVLNIGARKGSETPEEHWVYCRNTDSGFHRVGFYSNVDTSFLPASLRSQNSHVAVYVERAFRGGRRPDNALVERYKLEAVNELQAWGFIGELEALDANWIDVAYTWSWPGSRWRERAIEQLQDHAITQLGRYGNWKFQGIVDSIRDGRNWGMSQVAE